MSFESPLLVRSRNLYGRDAYMLADIESFGYEDWIPTLLRIERARTFKQQRVAMCTGIVSVAGSFHGLAPRGGERVSYEMQNVAQARFRVNDGLAQLSFIRSSPVQIGYQTADERCRKPAYAVVEGANRYHRVVKEPEEDLGEVELKFSETIALSLGSVLDNRYPGFELLSKLAEERDNTLD